MHRGKETAIALLSQARDALQEDLGHIGDAGTQVGRRSLAIPPRPPIFVVAIQHGLIELVAPPPNSPLKLNRLQDDLPDKLAAVTKAVRDLIVAVEHNNSAFGETVKQQLIVMLKIALHDLEAPYIDTSRLARTRDFLATVGTAAATGAATAILTKQFENTAAALGDAIDWIIKLTSRQPRSCNAS